MERFLKVAVLLFMFNLLAELLFARDGNAAVRIACIDTTLFLPLLAGVQLIGRGRRDSTSSS